MWITVLVMAIAVSMEPFRIGMTVLMLNRPRPTLQLLAFLSGGFSMAATVGLVVLFVFRPGLLGSAHFTLPKVQIVIGVLALLMAALLATGVVPAPKLPARARGLAFGPSLWVADSGGPGDRAAVHRLPGGAGRHRRFRRRPIDAGRGAGGIQRRRVHARGGAPRRLPVGAGEDTGVDARAQRLDPIASPPRSGCCAGRGRVCAARGGDRGSVIRQVRPGYDLQEAAVTGWSNPVD